jgi:membrane protease YdiL (CAAX protease family)
VTNPAAGAELHGPALVAGVLLVGYLVVGQPLVGRWNQRRFARAVARDPEARLRRYRRTAVLEWLLLALALLLVAAAPGLSLAQLGVRPPRLAGDARPFTVLGLFGLAATAGVFAVVRQRLHRHPAPAPVAPEAVLALLPRTFRERRSFAGVALTAGICEETLYRGLLIAVCTALWASLGPAGAVAASALAFGLAHLYQGPWGMLGTGVLGGCLAVLYVGSGSLLLPVCYHALLDLRVLLLPPPRMARPGRHAAAAPPASRPGRRLGRRLPGRRRTDRGRGEDGAGPQG